MANSNQCSFWAVAAVCGAVLTAAHDARADRLTADQIVIIANADSKASLEVARYYASRRGIRRTISVSMPLTETVTRRTYNEQIVPKIRQALESADLKDTTRCLVCTYDVPIRVGPRKPTDQDRLAASKVAEQIRTVGAQLKDVTGRMLAIGQLHPRPGGHSTTQPVQPAVVDQVLGDYLDADQRLKQWLQGDQSSAEAVRQYAGLFKTARGVASMLDHVQTRSGQADQAKAAMVVRLRHEIVEQRELVAMFPTDPRREGLYDRVGNVGGLAQLLQLLASDHRELLGTDGGAAFDSELALLWWGDYPISRWVANPLNIHILANPGREAVLPPTATTSPTLMIARLDGSSPALVRRIIDDSIAVEATGLRGRAYIDAGKRNDATYAAFDDRLVSLAGLLRSRTQMATALNTASALFPPGSCPNTALYCGWHSPGMYVPALSLVRGSVAVHIGSFEAISLRDRTKAYWCRRLLEDGAAATYGPVNEPYLHSFAPPEEFFGLLLTGEVTLAQAFAMTKPLCSWKQILIGDPLYRPFAVNPQLKREALDLPKN